MATANSPWLIVPHSGRQNHRRHHLVSHFVTAKPIMWAVRKLVPHTTIHPATVKYSVSFTVVFAGAFMATHPWHAVPHFLWDGIAYTIHGFGAAPIGEDVVRYVRAFGRKA